MSDTTTVATYVGAETQVLSAANGVDYAFRATGAADGTPLVTFQHFRGNLDNWDPALIDALARGRRVITFDNRGVAASTGATPSTIAQMALDAIDFIDALGVGEVDLLGFSIGSFVAQEIALVRPSTVHKVILASSAPQGASGMHGWAPDVIEAVGKPETAASRLPARLLHRLRCEPRGGTAGRRPPVRGAHGRPRRNDELADAAGAIRRGVRLGTAEPLPARARLGDRQAVFVANGDSDPMILPRYSYLLAGLIPHARLKIYPDAAHGFLFQHHAEFAADVDAFLAST